MSEQVSVTRDVAAGPEQALEAGRALFPMITEAMLSESPDRLDKADG